MGNQSKLRGWGQPTAEEITAISKFIAGLKKNGRFKVVRVVLLRLKHGLAKDDKGCVDPLLTLPQHLHPVWRQIVACTQVWTDRMARRGKKKLVQGLMQRGPMDHLFNLQGAVYGDCYTVMLGCEWDEIKPVCSYLFDATEENLLDDWRLGLLMTIQAYPKSLVEELDAKDLLALSYFSPVLSKDLKRLQPWASFSSLRIRLGCVEVCWWVLKVLLESPRKRKFLCPAGPQTLCAAVRFKGQLAGVGAAQAGKMGGPMYCDRNVERR